ncbi:DNA-binding protein [Edwardsiella phage vB_EpM_ZHS]|jgi:hypothetical protein|nr:DNA-binding protein [Edwardsiella phage vB_EpM_ZHS]
MTTRNTITTKAVQQAFNVSHMTIHAWRKGGPNKEPLPVVSSDSRAVLFKPAEVKRWAKAHKIEIVDPTALVPGAEVATKPGPKAKAVVKKSALRVKPASKPSPRKLAKQVARSDPRASSVEKAQGRARGHMAI